MFHFRDISCENLLQEQFYVEDFEDQKDKRFHKHNFLWFSNQDVLKEIEENYNLLALDNGY